MLGLWHSAGLPFPLEVPSHSVQMLQSTYLLFSLKGIGLEVPEEKCDSTQGWRLQIRHRPASASEPHSHGAWPRLPDLCMKRTGEVVSGGGGVSGVGGMDTGPEGSQVCSCVFFFSYRKENGVEEKGNSNTCVAFTLFSSDFSS